MAQDRGSGNDHMGISAKVALSDGGREQGSLRLEKWEIDQVQYVRHLVDLADYPPGWEPKKDDFLAFGVKPFEIAEFEDCNLITNGGWNLLLKGKTLLSTDSAPTIWFDTTHGRIGAGTGVAGAVATDTNLTSIAAMTGNNWILSAAAPTVTTSARTAIFTASFGLSDAVGAWNEWAIDQGTASAATVTATAPMINHAVGSFGTKTGAMTYTVTATLTFT